MTTQNSESRPLRVCHVITGLGQGGAEQVLCRLVEGDLFQNQITVVSLTGRGIYADRLEAAKATVVTLSITGLPTLVLGLFRLASTYMKFKPDVVQTWMYHADFFGGVVARLMRIPVAWGLRGSNLSSTHIKAGTRLVARLCAVCSGVVPTTIVACARRAAHYHRQRGYGGNVVVIPNGLSLSAYGGHLAESSSLRESLGLGELFVVAHVGRANTQKDHATLLRAFKLLLAERPESRLLLIGAGLEHDSNYLHKFDDYASIKEQVISLGSRSDVPILLQASDIFALSSVSEGFPNVVAEAMASALPCVVTDCGDAAEMVADTGWVVPVQRADLMALAFVQAANESSQERLQRRRATRARATEVFGLPSMVKAYQRVWLEMVK